MEQLALLALLAFAFFCNKKKERKGFCHRDDLNKACRCYSASWRWVETLQSWFYVGHCVLTLALVTNLDRNRNCFNNKFNSGNTKPEWNLNLHLQLNPSLTPNWLSVFPTSHCTVADRGGFLCSPQLQDVGLDWIITIKIFNNNWNQCSPNMIPSRSEEVKNTEQTSHYGKSKEKFPTLLPIIRREWSNSKLVFNYLVVWSPLKFTGSFW